MNNSLALIPSQNEFAAMMELADVMVKSGFLPQSIRNANQAVTIMMVGRELNIPPWQALNGVTVIQGKPTLAPQLMLALIYRTGLSEGIGFEEGKDSYTVTMKRKGEPVKSETFTMADATRMGLASKDNWKKQPMTMLKWRAVAACARVAYPDVIMGMYTTEEIAPDNVTISEDGSVDFNTTPIVVVERPSLTEKIIDISGSKVDVTTGEIVEDKPLPSQKAERIIKDKPTPKSKTVTASEPTALTWDGNNVLPQFVDLCRDMTGHPDLTLPEAGRLVGIEKPGVLQQWVDKFALVNDAIGAVQAAIKAEAELEF
jgi:hypothetical protein